MRETTLNPYAQFPRPVQQSMSNGIERLSNGACDLGSLSKHNLYGVCVSEPGEIPEYLERYGSNDKPILTRRSSQALLNTDKGAVLRECEQVIRTYPHARVVTFIAERIA